MEDIKNIWEDVRGRVCRFSLKDSEISLTGKRLEVVYVSRKVLIIGKV